MADKRSNEVVLEDFDGLSSALPVCTVEGEVSTENDCHYYSPQLTSVEDMQTFLRIK